MRTLSGASRGTTGGGGRTRGALPSLGLVAGLLTLAACSGGGGAGAGDDGFTVLTSSYPLEYVVREVGGSRVEVINLTARGADSHATELTPRQVAALGGADLVVHLSGLQPGVDAALAQQQPEHLLDAAPLADREGDPHVWLDPGRMATLAGQVADRLTELDPSGASDHRAGARALVTELRALDEEYAAALAPCRGATLVTAHEAFGYLADAYGLEQVGIAGIDPHVEPSPARLRDVVDVVEGRGVRTVFFEATTSPRVAGTLAEDLGVATAVLHPVERVAEDETYPSLMRANLAALAAGLDCDGDG
ncbi:metal ABC transporter substrate-binding protein [Cellulomonas endophytica]|uniref:metal ABC transporter substrate-binding protein n=1 Tax=Cellulomonas endophytica TaxID=2494735 RepID=UPI001010A203|nr:metal ABC transporter substrate-binding protein [Cellulomonas endophytica]